MNISSALTHAADILDAAGVADPRREAASLLALALDKPNTFLIAHPEYELTADEATIFESYVARREKREPFQYISGRQEFYGLDFEVTPAVLIPRPETEILVEEAIKELNKLKELNPLKELRFCEVGVGSGCISVSILANVPTATAVATDISAAAIEVAGRNAERHNVADRLTLVEGDLFAGVEGKFDLIVSNPPYVPDADLTGMQSEVRDYEPSSALYSGRDGLETIRRLIADSQQYLNSKGIVLIEIGHDQSESVRELIDPAVWIDRDFLKDLQGYDRVVRLRS